MSQLLITRREFQRAYRNHFQAYLQWTECKIRVTQSRLLLLFYAAECGLKAIWLKEHRLENSMADPNFYSYGHDINKLLSDLRADLRLPTGFRTLSKNSRDVRTEQLNQAWRYGCELKDELPIEDQLRIVCDWVGREL